MSPQLPKKIPETNSMSSLSVDDLLELQPTESTPTPTTAAPELSLPTYFPLTKPPPQLPRPQLLSTSSATEITRTPSPSRIPRRQVPRPVRHSVAVPPTTQQLPHYNRLSAKRNSKARMSYIKAVTTSKQKPEANTDTKPGKNKTQVSNNSEQHRVQNDLHCLHVEQENDKPEHEKVVHTLTERNEVCFSVNLSLVHVLVSHLHTTLPM